MQVSLLIVPYDSGHRGLRLGAGPEHLLESGIVDRLSRAGHQVEPEFVEAAAVPLNLENQVSFELTQRIASRVREIVNAGSFPVVLAGNCMTALGTVAGLGCDRTGVVWFDCHGDFNTPDSTEGGFLDGMALATLTGRCWKTLARMVPEFRAVPEENVILVGARDLDHQESRMLEDSNIIVLPPGDQALRFEDHVRRLSNTVEQIYLHIDLDVVDPSEAKVNSYQTPGGLGVGQLEEAIQAAGRHAPFGGVTLAAFDPAADSDGRVSDIAMRALEAALRKR